MNGTNTSNTAFTGSGITDALVNDMYLNTSTGGTYRCTVAGNAANARWVYAGSIKGATGPQGPVGATGPQGPAYTHPTTSGNKHIPSGGAAGQFLKWLSDGVAQWASLGAAALAGIANNLTTTNAGFALDARVGPVIDKRCTDLETSVSNLNSALVVEKTGTFNLIAATQTLVEHKITEKGLYLIIFCPYGYSNVNTRIMAALRKNTQDVLVTNDFTITGYFGLNVTQVSELNVGDVIRATFYSNVNYTESSRNYTFTLTKLPSL